MWIRYTQSFDQKMKHDDTDITWASLLQIFLYGLKCIWWPLESNILFMDKRGIIAIFSHLFSYQVYRKNTSIHIQKISLEILES